MSSLRVERQRWDTVGQTWELGWWARASDKMNKVSTESRDKQAYDASKVIMEYFEFEQAAYGTVVDVGCGPTGKTCWLQPKHMIGLDPLLDDYRRMGWPMVEYFDECHSVPGEECVTQLIGIVDRIISINAVDHCFDAVAVLENCFKYLKPGGHFFLSVDCDKPAGDDPTHPLKLASVEMRQAIKDVGFKIDDEDVGLVGAPFTTCTKHSWGGGTAFHWYATKPIEKSETPPLLTPSQAIRAETERSCKRRWDGKN